MRALFLTGAVAGVLAATSFAGPAVAAGSWHIQADPTSLPAPELAGAACPSPTSCFVVGNFGAAPIDHLLEHWNGTKWTVVHTPTGYDNHDSEFNGISCSSPDACTAVGDDVDGNNFVHALIDRWNGHTWTFQKAPMIDQAWSVACPTATSCYVTTGSLVGVIAHWNGSAWSQQTIPSGFAASGDVACASDTSCWAIGVQNRSTATLVHWNGARWSVQSIAPVPGGRAIGMDAVGCSSVNNCFLVGSSFVNGDPSSDRRLVERWNGSTWSIVFTPLPSGATGGGFDAVACRTGGSCLIAGGYNPTASNTRTLVERWNGSAFVIEPTPNQGDSSFAAAACDPVKSCIAVGAGTDRFDNPTQLIERNP